MSKIGVQMSEIIQKLCIIMAIKSMPKCQVYIGTCPYKILQIKSSLNQSLVIILLYMF